LKKISEGHLTLLRDIYKYSVNGNILLIKWLDEFSDIENFSNYAKYLCSPEKYCADGVAFLSIVGEYIIYRFFNNDGSEEIMCGNSIFAIASLLRKEKVKLVLTNKNTISLGMRQNMLYTIITFNKTDLFQGNCIYHTGSPHFVNNVEDINNIDWNNIINKLDVNYTVYQIFEDNVVVRTFERSVNYETNACGTGALAVFFDMWEKKGLEKIVVSFNNNKYYLSILDFNDHSIKIESKISRCSVNLMIKP
jgi:diaminopimelate epimerase